jgi:hypothetical protein
MDDEISHPAISLLTPTRRRSRCKENLPNDLPVALRPMERTALAGDRHRRDQHHPGCVVVTRGGGSRYAEPAIAQKMLSHRVGPRSYHRHVRYMFRQKRQESARYGYTDTQPYRTPGPYQQSPPTHMSLQQCTASTHGWSRSATPGGGFSVRIVTRSKGTPAAKLGLREFQNSGHAFPLSRRL